MCDIGATTISNRLNLCNYQLSLCKPELVVGIAHRLRVAEEEAKVEALLKQQRLLNEQLAEKKHQLLLCRDPEYKKEYEQKQNVECAEKLRNTIQDLKDEMEKDPRMNIVYQKLLMDQQMQLTQYEAQI